MELESRMDIGSSIPSIPSILEMTDIHTRVRAYVCACACVREEKVWKVWKVWKLPANTGFQLSTPQRVGMEGMELLQENFRI